MRVFSLLSVIVLLNLITTESKGHTLPRSVISSAREENETFSQAYERFVRDRNQFLSMHKLDVRNDDSVYMYQQSYEDLAIAESIIPEWESVEKVTEYFIKVRDERFLKGTIEPKVMRRLSWLYPDDGCFDRAAHMRRMLEKWKVEKIPAKIFIMGDLKVATENHPGGYVYWYYHVVPVVRVGQVAYVLDPAIEPSKPLELHAWAERQNKSVDNVKFSICNGFSYAIGSRCRTATINDEYGTENSISDFLDYEWERQETLKRDPFAVLGDNPPWQVQ